MLEGEDIHHAEVLWQYLNLRHEAAASDVILCLGSNDLAVARVGAELWHRRLAPYIIMTGGLAHIGDLAATGWDRTEAAMFADVARTSGVPAEALITETEAKNTGDNFRLSRALLPQPLATGLRTVLVVSKPYMTRRAYATGHVQWPGITLRMQSEAVELQPYLSRWADSARILNLMVGDFHRIMVYPALGFQAPQNVTEAALAAFRALVSRGFDRHLVAGAQV